MESTLPLYYNTTISRSQVCALEAWALQLLSIVHLEIAHAYTSALEIIQVAFNVLSQIDALLETLSSEEKELLKRKSCNDINRRRKPFIGNKRVKRKTRNIAWKF